MIFTPGEIIKLKRFCQEIIDKPRMMDAQPSERRGAYIWCEDWEIIEILKYLFNGPAMYADDPPPNRLKNNPLWSKDQIKSMAESYLENYQTADSIITALRSLRNGSPSRI